MDWLELLYMILPYVITALIGAFAAYYGIFKGKLQLFKKFIDVLDNALEDNTITSEELKKIIASAKELIGI